MGVGMAVSVSAAGGAAQGAMFGPGENIHDVLVRSAGVSAAVGNALEAHSHGHGGLARVLSGRSGRAILDVAQGTAVRDAEGGSEPGYSYSAWSLVGLPHRSPPAGDWVIETDIARLVVSPGSHLLDDNTTLSAGVPCGSYARLALVAWQTEALLHGRREISMGDTARRVLDWLRVPAGGTGADAALKQIYRLATCGISFHFRRRAPIRPRRRSASTAAY